MEKRVINARIIYILLGINLVLMVLVFFVLFQLWRIGGGEGTASALLERQELYIRKLMDFEIEMGIDKAYQVKIGDQYYYIGIVEGKYNAILDFILWHVIIATLVVNLLTLFGYWVTVKILQRKKAAGKTPIEGQA